MENKARVLIIDDVHELLVDGLKQLGYEVWYKPLATREELLHDITSVTGLIVRTKTKIDAEVLSAAPKLKFIGRAGAGLDNIDEFFAEQKQIFVFNAGEANSDAVGEHTIGMMLSLFAKINKGDAEVRKMIWDRNGNRGIELSGRTVGIIGYGNTGKAVAKKLSGFGVRVLAYDKYLQNYSDRWATEAGMEEIFEQAELLTLHVPLTKETQKMVDQSYINKFRNNIWLFNLSRGGVVKTDEIPELMESGKLLGVGLDVLENENIEKMNTEERKWFTYIAGSDRTVITPHVAGWTLESYRKISEVLLKKIKDLKLNISAS